MRLHASHCPFVSYDAFEDKDPPSYYKKAYLEILTAAPYWNVFLQTFLPIEQCSALFTPNRTIKSSLILTVTNPNNFEAFVTDQPKDPKDYIDFNLFNPYNKPLTLHPILTSDCPNSEIVLDPSTSISLSFLDRPGPLTEERSTKQDPNPTPSVMCFASNAIRSLTRVLTKKNNPFFVTVSDYILRLTTYDPKLDVEYNGYISQTSWPN